MMIVYVSSDGEEMLIANKNGEWPPENDGWELLMVVISQLMMANHQRLKSDLTFGEW